eukprot:scaffold3768_cov184-Isochrysis_galbana.AAC.1
MRHCCGEPVLYYMYTLFSEHGLLETAVGEMPKQASYSSQGPAQAVRDRQNPFGGDGGGGGRKRNRNTEAAQLLADALAKPIAMPTSAT